MTALITFQWVGDAMIPLGRFRAKAAETFTKGEFYKLEAIEERSWKSHKHYFASLHDAWLNLPEQYALEPWSQTAENHLRKYALIKTGWHDSQTHACGSQAEAGRWAARIRPMDAYSIVVAQGSTVVVYTARSQSTASMGAKDFQKSKVDVLDFAWGLSGVSSEQHQKENTG